MMCSPSHDNPGGFLFELFFRDFNRFLRATVPNDRPWRRRRPHGSPGAVVPTDNSSNLFKRRAPFILYYLFDFSLFRYYLRIVAYSDDFRNNRWGYAQKRRRPEESVGSAGLNVIILDNNRRLFYCTSQ